MSDLINAKPNRATNIIDDKMAATWEMDRFMEQIESSINGFVQFNNYTAVVAPAVTDDGQSGYNVGSEWLDTTGPTWYKCSDNTNGAAVWTLI